MCIRDSFKTSISNNLADDRAILLFYEGLVILAIGPASREFDILAQAIIPNRLVHEDAVIVGVESEQCKREQFAQLGQCHRKYRLLAHQQRRRKGSTAIRRSVPVRTFSDWNNPA